MPITIFEGTDFAGKTTKAKKELDRCFNEGVPAIYLHFPIRKSSDIDIVNRPTLDASDFKMCPPLVDQDGNMLPLSVIQEIILMNIVANVRPILDYHDRGCNILIDRFILSNIVYRKLHNVPITSTCFNSLLAPPMQRLLEVARHDIIVPTETELALRERHAAQSRYSPECTQAVIRLNDEFDKLNEQLDNIYNTNKMYSYYAKSNLLHLSYDGFDVMVPLNSRSG